MSTPNDFSTVLQTAVAEKGAWFDTEGLPELLDNYRMLQTCIRNLFDVLVKRSLIVPDPYKTENPISTITAPEDSGFSENERATVIGMRLSDYESMLGFICSSYKFSVAHITLAEVKKLLQFNAAFQWEKLATSNSHMNTRMLAVLINEARLQAPAILLSAINAAMSGSSQAAARITAILHEYAQFKREAYKAEIRSTVMDNSQFDRTKANSSPETEVAEIKRLYHGIVGKQPFYADLAMEIAAEDLSADGEERRNAVLEKLKIKTATAAKKEEQIDTKTLIMAAVHALSAAAPQYKHILEKLRDNNAVLLAPKNTFMDTVKTLFRKLFNAPPPKINYTLTILDPQTNTRVKRQIEFGTFIANFERRTQYYNLIAHRQSREYAKIAAAPEKSILAFLEKQIIENQELLLLLSGLDDFFKSEARPVDKQKIKGLKMELTSLKNCIIKTNQKRVDYTSFIEQEAQMKRLGIQNVI